MNQTTTCKEKKIKSHSQAEFKEIMTLDESFQVYNIINKKMREADRNYQRKLNNSHAHAAKIVLTS